MKMRNHGSSRVPATGTFAGLAILALLAVGGSWETAEAQTVPSGFTTEYVVRGPLTGQPTAFAFLPDGRMIFVEWNSGVVRLGEVSTNIPVENDSIFTVPDVLHDVERGLLGVAVDPGFPTAPYIYFYLTSTDGFHHVRRYEASGDLIDSSSTNLVLSAPYDILLIPDLNGSHNGGTLRFGPDGMLYASNGDDVDKCSSADISSLNGKILRLDLSALPDSGGGPVPPHSLIAPGDNPFVGLGPNAQLVWAYGMRNPFRFCIDPLTGDLAIGDVGLNTWEEVNFQEYMTAPGENFGWPWFEASDPHITCDSGGTNTLPAYAYPHIEPFPANITGGPIYRSLPGSNRTFSPGYDGDIFFMDPNFGWIRRLKRTGNSWAIADPVPGQPDSLNWATDMGYFTDIQLGPDGAIYFINFLTGNLSRGIHRIVSDYATGVGNVADTRIVYPSVAIPNPAQVGEGTTIRYSLPGGTDVSIQVFDITGRLVRTLTPGRERESGAVFWDGRTDRGVPAGSGVFFYRLDPSSGPATHGRITLLR